MESEASNLLFAYGTLAPGSRGEAARAGWEPDMVRGRMFDLGPYPGLVGVDDEGTGAGWVAGFVRAVDGAELSGRLDEYEGVSEGLYRRVRTTTKGGRRVWVYVYARPLPAEARGPIERWEGARVDAFGAGGAAESVGHKDSKS